MFRAEHWQTSSCFWILSIFKNHLSLRKTIDHLSFMDHCNVDTWIIMLFFMKEHNLTDTCSLISLKNVEFLLRRHGHWRDICNLFTIIKLFWSKNKRLMSWNDFFCMFWIYSITSFILRKLSPEPVRWLSR